MLNEPFSVGALVAKIMILFKNIVANILILDMKLKLIIAALTLLPFLAGAQLNHRKNKFTKEDSLRGSLNENRDWWDVIRYDLEVEPDFESKSLAAKTSIYFKKIKPVKLMQLDLQQPLIVDAIFATYEVIVVKDSADRRISYREKRSTPLPFSQNKNVVLVKFDSTLFDRQTTWLFNENMMSVVVHYHGVPKEAKNAPWDGGWIWKKDSLGRPWMSVAVQGLGASAWYPCKDHQSDEPDDGASLTVIVPDSLTAVANGKLTRFNDKKLSYSFNDTATYFPKPGKSLFRWEVKSKINNYNIVPSIGKYVNYSDTLLGKTDLLLTSSSLYGKIDTIPQDQSTLELSYWVLDYNLERAKQQFGQVKSMLRCFEYWFGPYPFYVDDYKLVESPHLGMEHQSAIAYGNKYRNGYWGKDLSGSGWGSKWDFIIVHESAHEWFGNNITSKDIADMWIHEGFTSYSETLYTEYLFGKQAGDEYNYGIRKLIDNDKPIIGPYGVNEEGSGDMYYKASNMINIIRKVINNDTLFRNIFRGMNQEAFWHQTVTTQQVESYIIKRSGIDFQKLFDQYLRTTQIPRLEFYFGKGNRTVYYRWANCIGGFDLPLVINNKRYPITTKWKSSPITKDELRSWGKNDIEKLYYITVKFGKP